MPKWTKEEVSLLQQVWPYVTSKNWDHYFPERTYESVRHKAKCLKISNSRQGTVKSKNSWAVDAIAKIQAGEILDKPLADKLFPLLAAAGYNISRDTQIPMSASQHSISDAKVSDRYTMGIFSCSHLGDRWQQLTNLNRFYDDVIAAGGKDFFHAGDWVSGSHRMHKGFEFGLHALGADAQRDYAVKNFPRREGVITRGISGNHCLSHVKDAGFNIVKAICNERDDLEYCGDWVADFTLPGDFRMKLRHGRGGLSYSLSYRVQKLVEKLDRRTPPPHLMAVGHWHTPAVFQEYQGVYAMLLPAFQGMTPFASSLGIEMSHIGGYLVHYDIDEKGKYIPGSIQSNLLSYPERQNDY